VNHATVVMDVRTAVDKKIAPLVYQLLRLEGVYTMYSCEGNSTDNKVVDWGRTPAYVIFSVGDGSTAAVDRLLTFLMQRVSGLGKTGISLRSCDRIGHPRIRLHIHQDDISAVANWLDVIQPEWQLEVADSSV
jgi:hypothetical protein